MQFRLTFNSYKYKLLQLKDRSSMGKKKRSSPPPRTWAVLLACLLHGEKFGLQIRDEYEERTGTPLPLGTLYVTLDRMADAGMLTSREGESNPERGGNRRRYFKITAIGIDALNRFQQSVAAVMPAGRFANGT